MAKQIQSYKLGVQMEVDDRRATPVLQGVEKQTRKNVSAFKDLGSEIKLVMKGDVDAGKALGKQIGGNITGGIKDSILGLLPSLGTTIGSVIAPGIGTMIGGAIGTGLQIGIEKAGGAILNSIQRGLELNDQLELSQIHFTAFIGSEKEAAKHLEDLKKLSVSAGLDLPMLLQADQRLEEFNKDVKLSVLELNAAADASAAFGSGAEGFKVIADTLGLIAEKGELTSKVLLKLDKQNIPALKYLSQATGMSEKRLKELMAQGRIKGDVAARLIAEGIEREKGGYAAYRADNTSIGMEAKKNALSDQIAMKGTLGLQRIQDDYTRTLINIYQSPQAQATVEFLDSMVNKIVDVAEKGAKIGAGVTGGVIQGITSGQGVEKLTGAVTSIGNTAIGALKGVWEMNSPSKVFAGLGGFAIDSLAYGDENGNGGLGSEESKAKIRGALEGLLKDPRIQALLYAIEKAEGGAPNIIVGGKRFSDMSRHPNIVGLRTAAGPSTAAGSFQITGSNWYGRRGRPGLQEQLGLPDFSEHSQQLAALYLFMQRNKGAGIKALLNNDIETARGIAAKDWTSTPGSTIGGGRQLGVNRWMGYYNEGLQLAANGGAVTRANPMPVMVVKDLSGGADSFTPRRGRFTSIDAGEGSYEPMRTGGGPRVDVGFNEDSLRVAAPDGMPSFADASPQAILESAGEATRTLRSLADSVMQAKGLNDDLLNGQTSLVESAQLAASAYLLDPPIIKKSVEEVGKSIREQYQLSSEQIKLNHKMLVSGLREQLGGALQGITGMLPSGGGQTGGKKGFFSKLLGIAAPFLSFIPGAGPILSTIAGAASNALVGNWAGVASGVLANSSVQGLFNPTTKIAPSGGSFGASTGGANQFAGAYKTGLTPRAFGGPVQSGRPYLVGERRPEVFTPNQDGFIHPSADAFMRGGGSGQSSMVAMMERLHSVLDRLGSMPADHVVMTGARGMLRAMDFDASLSDGYGRRLRLP